ncbi:MAG: hypothetical protein KAH23_06935 [Kiritimatiellae bacterium]|nr:hypothetical protein [Kiritimatiellia bacterium]
MRRLTIMNICLVLFVGVGIGIAANTKKVTGSSGFDRPLIVDKKMERDLAALTKRISVLESEAKKAKAKNSGAGAVDNRKVVGLQRNVGRLEKQMSQLLIELTSIRSKIAVLGRTAEE